MNQSGMNLNNISVSNGSNSVNMTLPIVQNCGLSIWYLITMLISAIAALLLGLMVMAAAFHRNLRTPAGFLITHLFLTELIVSGLIYPMLATVNYLFVPKAEPILNCGALFVLLPFVQIAGNWSSFLLAMNRYIAMFYPHSYEKFSSKKVLIIAIATSWFLGFILVSPLIFDRRNVMGFTKDGTCGLQQFEPYNYTVRLAIGYYSPMLAEGILYCSLFIRVALAKRRKTAAEQQSPAEAVRFNRRLNVSKALFASFFWYAICYLPSPTVNANTKLFFSHLTGSWLRTVAEIGYLGHPIIFLAMSSDYRKAVGNILHCHKPQKVEGVTVKGTSRTSRTSGGNTGGTQLSKFKGDISSSVAHS